MPADPLTAELPPEFGPRVGLDELLVDLGKELNAAMVTIDWIDGHYDIDVQFLRSHIKSVLHEIDYFFSLEPPK